MPSVKELLLGPGSRPLQKQASKNTKKEHLAVAATSLAPTECLQQNLKKAMCLFY